jgi:hypothetical protein
LLIFDDLSLLIAWKSKTRAIQSGGDGESLKASCFQGFAGIFFQWLSGCAQGI